MMEMAPLIEKVKVEQSKGLWIERSLLLFFSTIVLEASSKMKAAFLSKSLPYWPMDFKASSECFELEKAVDNQKAEKTVDDKLISFRGSPKVQKYRLCDSPLLGGCTQTPTQAVNAENSYTCIEWLWSPFRISNRNMFLHDSEIDLP